MEDASPNPESILKAKEERWAKKLAMAKFLDSAGLSETASLAVLTLRMPASLRLASEFADTALSLHSSFTRSLREHGITLFREEFRVGGDGPESYFAAGLDPVGLKRLAAAWEIDHPWGELADLDVMDARGNPVGRSELGYPARKCLVCEEDAAVCSTGRIHGLAAIEARVREILARPEHLGVAEDGHIGRLALTAVLYEVSAAPKPGLVDPFSRGAHVDMDYLTFLSSAAALGPYFAEFARLGRLHGGEASDLLPALRETGMAAERAMYAATGGVNTHKGLIFSLGLLCAAAGRRQAAGCRQSPQSCAEYAAAIVKGISDKDFTPPKDGAEPRTTGERLYRKYKVRGIRGEAEEGFPSVIGHALPRLLAGLQKGLSWNDAMVDTLFELFSFVEDTNVLGRAGQDGLVFLRSEAASVIRLGGMSTEAGREATRAMDISLTKRNISPGGCADLLALTVFLEMLDPSLIVGRHL
jgi:holo-ACP synthase/triphosphoribosyl-dephospho-CoA synthase